MRELRGDVARTKDDHVLGERVDPHDGVGGVERDAGLRDHGWHGRAAARGHDDAVRGELDRPTGKVDHQPARTGEPRVPLVEGDVRAPGGAIVAARHRDGVDASEDAVAHVDPPHLVHRGVDAEVAGALDGARDIGGMHEHLRRDAADVQARATERATVDQRHVEWGEPGVEERVARAGADDDEVVVAHSSNLVIPPVDLRLAPLRR